MNHPRTIEVPKDKNDVITWCNKILKIINAKNELHSKIDKSTKDNTKMKTYLKKKMEKIVLVLFFCVLYLLGCIFHVVFFVLYINGLYFL